jgi:hypothetical protein
VPIAADVSGGPGGDGLTVQMLAAFDEETSLGGGDALFD